LLVGLRLSVVVVGLNVTELHLLRRFATLIVPSPVARSYPLPVLYPPNTPYACPAVFTVQFGEPFWQGMEIVPEVTSLNTQVLAGPALELHDDAVCWLPSLYKM
jgi:hypothetical protein